MKKVTVTIADWEHHLRSQHPKMAHLPDYGLAIDPEYDIRLRTKAEAAGVDYDALKHEFCLLYQVIPNCYGEARTQMLEKGAIPLSALNAAWRGTVDGAIAALELKQSASPA